MSPTPKPDESTEENAKVSKHKRKENKKRTNEAVIAINHCVESTLHSCLPSTYTSTDKQLASIRHQKRNRRNINSSRDTVL